MPTALVRQPSPRLDEGLVTHIERRPVDVALAAEQWAGYVAALHGAGWETWEVAPAPDCPDSVFIEDTVVVFGSIAVVTRPGAVARRPELAGPEEAVTGLGYTVRRIEAPGTLDGGDVLKVDATVYVGAGGRTNGLGIRQLRSILRPAGLSVVAVPVTKALHLKSTVTALPDCSVVGYAPLVDAPEFFPHFRSVPEESGSHVVVLDDDRLLVAADCPGSVSLFTTLGYEVVAVDISEFQKLEGCVTCLSVRLRHPSAGR